jgi:hypothetical protein
MAVLEQNATKLLIQKQVLQQKLQCIIGFSIFYVAEGVIKNVQKCFFSSKALQKNVDFVNIKLFSEQKGAELQTLKNSSSRQTCKLFIKLIFVFCHQMII